MVVLGSLHDFAELGGLLGGIGAIVACVVVPFFLRDRRTILLRQERDDEQKRRKQLEERLGELGHEVQELRLQRSNEPVLQAVAKTNGTLGQVLDKLITVNGSLGRQEQALKEVTDGLAAATEALKLVGGLVVSADLKAQPKRGT